MQPGPRAVRVRSLEPTPSDEALGRALVREYTHATAEEMATPGTPPDVAGLLQYIPDWSDFAGRYFEGGAFLIAAEDAREGGAAPSPALAGGVGIARADATTCEMNRLWVRPTFRGQGIARKLILESLCEARRLGFKRMALDALTTRTRAIALYRQLGFKDAPPRHHYGFEVVSLEQDL